MLVANCWFFILFYFFIFYFWDWSYNRLRTGLIRLRFVFESQVHNLTQAETRSMATGMPFGLRKK